MNPEDLLPQIIDLLQQYMEGGGDPAAIAEALQGGGGAPPAGPDAGGGMPPAPDEGLEDPMPMMSGDTEVPDLTGMAPEGGVPAGTSLREASMMAEEDMKKRMKR